MGRMLEVGGVIIHTRGAGPRLGAEAGSTPFDCRRLWFILATEKTTYVARIHGSNLLGQLIALH